MKRGERPVHGQVVLAGEPAKLAGMRRGPSAVAAHQFEQRRMVSGEGMGADVRNTGEPFLTALEEEDRAIDVAERPYGDRKADEGGDARVQTESQGQVVVATRLEKSQRMSNPVARVAILSGEEMGHAAYAMGDARLGRFGPLPHVAEKGLRVRRHRGQFAANIAAGPQAVDRRQPFGSLFVARGEFTSPGKGVRRFRRAVTARGEERLAVSNLQPSLSGAGPSPP